MNEQIELMKAWCAENYNHGADTMIECWDDAEYASLWDDGATDEQAWYTLRAVASVYAERRDDAKNSAF